MRPSNTPRCQGSRRPLTQLYSPKSRPPAQLAHRAGGVGGAAGRGSGILEVARAAGQGPGGPTSAEPAGAAGKSSDLAAEATAEITARRPARPGQRARLGPAAKRARKVTAISGLVWQRDADPPAQCPQRASAKGRLRPREAGRCPQDTQHGGHSHPGCPGPAGGPHGCPLLLDPHPLKKRVGTGQARDSLWRRPSLCPQHPLGPWATP